MSENEVQGSSLHPIRTYRSKIVIISLIFLAGTLALMSWNAWFQKEKNSPSEEEKQQVTMRDFTKIAHWQRS